MVLRGVERTVIEASTLARSKVYWEGVRCVGFRRLGSCRDWDWDSSVARSDGFWGYSSSGLRVWESCQQPPLDSTTPLKIHLHDKLRVIVLMSSHGVSFSQPTHM